jgi:hypothetical protein
MPLWPDAGRQLGLSRNATYQAADRGQIPGVIRIGRRLLVCRDPFERFLQEGMRPTGTLPRSKPARAGVCVERTWRSYSAKKSSFDTPKKLSWHPKKTFPLPK